ncbi:uncharacterized protein [Aegilops tauschii subsp. strangulata]|uniref:uncharacterized protein n=1 Tax=Aegilops tauschii subsp. strangulata TaxID=200361 RepID=UPI001E1CAA16|nr:uncharacterized protein LOC109749847 [Aegilops tauschii subsp. strangulata]
MHFFQVVVAWMFPCAVCATMAPAVATAATTDGASTVEHVHAGSTSPAFSPGGVKVSSDSGSSPSSRSSTSSSLLGARSSSSNSARSPVREGGACDTAAPKGHAVRRCLRRFAKNLQRAGAADERPDGRRRRKGRATRPDGRGAAAEDGTAREREEAVASAIAYCKESSRQRCRPPLAPSPSLDGWLLVRPEEEIGNSTTSAASHCECEGPGTSSLDAECVGSSPSSAETRRGPAPELGEDDVFDGLDGDVLRMTSYFAAKYVQCAIEE